MSAGAERERTQRATARALWNLRGLALFLVGPALGVGLVAGVFGLPPALAAAAAAMSLFSLAMFGLLVRGERRRLLRSGQSGRPGVSGRVARPPAG